jgi:hypothetical protein
MFDIKEYFDSDYRLREPRHDIVNIDEDLSFDINNLLSSRFDSLYKRDRYKNGDSMIEILYPGLQYPGSSALMLNPDRIRYLLSFYPGRGDFANIEKIVIRPRFIEIGSIELVALYLRRKKILVLYQFHPHFYRMHYAGSVESGGTTENNLDTILKDRLTDDTIRQDENTDALVHPLWYLLSIVRHENDDKIDKFFIKKADLNDRIYEVLNDISSYYARHGY